MTFVLSPFFTSVDLIALIESNSMVGVKHIAVLSSLTRQASLVTSFQRFVILFIYLFLNWEHLPGR